MTRKVLVNNLTVQTDKLLFLSHIRVFVLKGDSVVVDWLLFVTPIVEFCVCFIFSCELLCHSSWWGVGGACCFTMPSWCLVIVLYSSSWLWYFLIILACFFFIISWSDSFFEWNIAIKACSTIFILWRGRITYSIMYSWIFFFWFYKYNWDDPLHISRGHRL